MKDIKTQKTFTDYGFGFPVKITNAPLKKIRGKWVLDVNQNIYEKSILILLANKASRLSGNEIKFIRHYFKMSLESFGKRFGNVAHSAVIKWEKFKDESTNMNWACEKDIRLFLINHLEPKLLIDVYSNLSEVVPSKPSTLKLDSSDLLAA